LTVVYNDLLNESTTTPGVPETPSNWEGYPSRKPTKRETKKGGYTQEERDELTASIRGDLLDGA